MAFDLHKNFALSQVVTAPSPATSGTSLTVTSGQGSWFPTPPFNATVWPSQGLPLATNAEIVRVTAISTNTLTITRTQEGSTARAIVVGDQICATTTNKVLSDIETGLAGGVLSGNYPNPGMAAGAAATNIGTIGGDMSSSSTFANMLYRPQSGGLTAALPASPQDGQIAYCLADSVNHTMWRFKYNASYSGAQKWEFIGGGPLFATSGVNAAGNTNTGTGVFNYFGLPNGAITVNIPFTGTYYVWTGGSIYSTSAGMDYRGVLTFLAADGSASTIAATHRLYVAVAYNGMNLSNGVVINVTTNGAGTLQPAWASNSTTVVMNYPSPWGIHVYPIRVSG